MKQLTCIDIEQVIAGHAWLAWHACWDNDKVAALERCCQLIWAGIRSHLYRSSAGEMSSE
jgi:hypothetical protein